MLPDYRAIMRARMGLGKPLEGYSLGNEGRDPRPQNLGSMNDFQQPPKPDPWVNRPQDLGAPTEPSMGQPKPEGWVPHPLPEGGPSGYLGGGFAKPEGRTPKQASGFQGFGAMRNPWQRF